MKIDRYINGKSCEIIIHQTYNYHNEYKVGIMGKLRTLSGTFQFLSLEYDRHPPLHDYLFRNDDIDVECLQPAGTARHAGIN